MTGLERTEKPLVRNGVISVDIKTDYVRSLSSASFVLEIQFESDDGKRAAMHLAVSSGTCASVDGDMKADVIYLYPEQKGSDISVGNQSIYSAADLNALCDLLFHAATIRGWHNPMAEYNAYAGKIKGITFAIDGKRKCYDSHRELIERIEKLGGTVSGTISSGVNYLICNDKASGSRKASKARLLGIPIISDFDFACGAFGKEQSSDEQENFRDDGITVSVTDVAPITIGNFKNACAEAGITLETIKKITIRNNKFGNRDSAMFIFCNNAQFLAYKKRYAAAPEEQRKSIAEAFITFVKSGPTLAVNDNEFELPETMCCVWNNSDESLEKEMRAYLEGNDPGHWMGTYSQEFTIDYTGRTLTAREVLFYGDI
jgi:hypothetical protein